MVRSSYCGTNRWLTLVHFTSICTDSEGTRLLLTLLRAVDDVFQEVDSDGIVGWQVGSSVDREEGVDLPLGLVLGFKLLGRDIDVVVHASEIG
jgi:hypothetical protein